MIKLATNLQNLLIKQSKDGTCWKGYKQVGKKMKGGKLVPDCVPADKQAEVKQAENSPTNPELWARAKAKARSKFDVYPSAYANGWAAKWYKDQGGGWKKTKSKSDDSSKQSNLNRWFEEKWVDISKKDESGKHPPCGRSDADEKSGYPKCRPSKRVSEETPETTKSMSKEEKAKAVAQKRRAEAKPREGKKPHMTSHNKAAGIKEGKNKPTNYFLTAEDYLTMGKVMSKNPNNPVHALANYAGQKYPGLRLSTEDFMAIDALRMIADKKGPYKKDPIGTQYSLAPDHIFERTRKGITRLNFNDEDEFTASKKTKKKANTLASESIVDVPIRCTPGFGCKRYLTPQEAAEVALAKQQIMPDYLATEADPVSSQMSSPSWSAAGHGLLGALLGAGVGAGGGKLLGSNVPLSALLGGALGGIGGGLYGYGSKVRKNKEIEDLIEDLPVGADIGDIEVFSDPKLKQQLARDFQRQLVRRGLMNENERSY